jgi:putative pyruvate formate lyase activating enzyme
MCPRLCGVNRSNGSKGYCNAGAGYEIASITAHHGEEPVISGKKGICNVFFYHCNLQCIYCQNYQISERKCRVFGHGETLETVVRKITSFLDQGIENLGFVSPSHMVPQMITIIRELQTLGYRPITVYNTNAYDTIETLRMVEEWVDVYLPDLKYVDPDLSAKWSDAADYPEVAKAALREMYRQKGNKLHLNANGIAEKGLLVRHLVLPGSVENSKNVLRFLAEELSPRLSVSLMSQYYPVPGVEYIRPLNRKVTRQEYQQVVEEMENLGFSRGWIQEHESSDHYRPDFHKENPFE